ncbi:MAG TPA: rhodanese-like domain-containing protein [Terriglobales bacterium]|nr:rhodanese-like domain-containing protein [Terriglobales bacterium]
MYFEQFYLGCLAHASYMIGSKGEAAVVDPQRDVDLYLKAAAEHGLTIRYVFETHLHADFVSGHRELAQRTGAKICLGTRAGATFPHIGLTDGMEIQVGDCRLRALETPGHTIEGICLVVFDPEKGDKPHAVLTGDTLFIGDVGRPDLSDRYTPQELAGMLYDSLHQKLMALPDETLVYPAHGAGSLCGRNMRADRFSTIGTERVTNHALQIKSREEFIAQLTTNLPTRPAYFAQDAAINREGAEPLDHLPPLLAIGAAELHRYAGEVTILDTRAAADFAAAHIPGSIFIGLSGQFASWAGSLLGLQTPLVLVAESKEKAEEARMRLARVGIETTRGYLEGGIDAWRAAGFALESVPQVTIGELRQRLEAGIKVLDVRRRGEWDAGHIDKAQWHALDDFPAALPKIDSTAPTAVHCKSGYRSMIACSYLQRAGHRNVVNVVGGYDAWLAETAAAAG